MTNDDVSKEIYLSVPSSAIYYRVNRAIAAADFTTDEQNKWPTADLTSPRRSVKALAQLRPLSAHEMKMATDLQIEHYRQKMLAQVLELSDDTCDILDASLHIWMKHATTPGDWATVSVDQILRIKGFRRRSLTKESRAVVSRQMEILQNLWLTVFEMEVPEETVSQTGKKRTTFKTWRGESRALHIDARFGPLDQQGEIRGEVYRLRPGEVLAKYIMGPGRQTALLAQKALYFDSSNYWPEKRLCRFFAYQWRCRMAYKALMGPFKVRTLLDSIHMPVDEKRPSRTKERLERALMRLKEHAVIRSFRTDPSFGSVYVGRKGWTESWLDSLVTVEPSQIVEQHYVENPKLLPPASHSGSQQKSIGARLREGRIASGKFQRDLAKHFGITPTWLSLIETGRREPSSDLSSQIENWLAEWSGPH